MKALFALLFGLLLAGSAMAVTEPECWAQSNTCWANCCESNGFEWDWSDEGCYVPEDMSDAEMMELCGYCDDQYFNCVEGADAGCCMGFVLFAAAVGLFAFRTRK
ncbi:MAG: hypothetical protein GY852_11065 [bacterium]|nr:hypothetical protein [bacterium]